MQDSRTINPTWSVETTEGLMVIAYLFIAHAIGFGQIDTVELAVHHTRATKTMTMLKKIASADPKELVTLTADDSRGIILARGSRRGIDWVREYLELLDVARLPVSFKITISSEVDHSSSEVSAKIPNAKEWKTSDGETGVTVTLTPRINDDATTTFMCEIRAGYGANTTSISTIFRLKTGQSQTISLGDIRSGFRESHTEKALNNKSAKLQEPVITVELEKQKI